MGWRNKRNIFKYKVQRGEKKAVTKLIPNICISVPNEPKDMKAEG